MKNQSAKLSGQQHFNSRLCEMMIAADIPHRLEHPKLKEFIQESTKINATSECTLRLNYVAKQFEDIQQHVRDETIGQKLCLIFDESTDKMKRKVLHILVDKLDANEFKPRLFDVKFLEKASSTTVFQSINESMASLYSNSVIYDYIILLVSDQAPYMIATGKLLKTMFPKLKHFTCIIHAIHRVCLKILDIHKDVNKFMASFQSLFVRANYRIENYKTQTGLALPPNVIITRWASWLVAVVYVTTNYTKKKQFISDLPKNNNMAIRNLHELIQKPELENELLKSIS